MTLRASRITWAAGLLLIPLFLLPLPSTAVGMPARFAVTPDNNLELLLSVIQGARSSLLVNIYQFDHPKIREAILGLIQGGVSVEILLEGEPLGNISPEGKKTIQTLVDAMQSQSRGTSRFYLMTKEASTKGRRYRFDHAKYVIADQAETLVTSDNFGRTGHPEAGLVGNRGWDVAVRDRALAIKMTRIFREDVDLNAGDILELVQGRNPISQPRGPLPVENQPKAAKRTLRPFDLGAGQVDQAEIVASPNSLPGLVSLMRAAQHTLDVQHMSFPATWRDGSKTIQNPLMRESLDAARRGAQVRVLLNDDNAFGQMAEGGLKGNDLSASVLNDAAECEGISLEARIIDLKAVQITYIHNKGVLADGDRALISSINGTQNSVMNNREIALDLHSVDAARYYGHVFDFDWTSSSRVPKNPQGPGCRGQLISFEAEMPGILQGALLDASFPRR